MKYVVMVLVVIGLAMSFMSRGDSKGLVSYEKLQQKLTDKAPIVPVSYTHLTLPTN